LMKLNTSNCCSSFPRMPSSYQFALWKQECFLVPSLFFRILLGQTHCAAEGKHQPITVPSYKHKIPEDVSRPKRFEMCSLDATVASAKHRI